MKQGSINLSSILEDSFIDSNKYIDPSLIPIILKAMERACVKTVHLCADKAEYNTNEVYFNNDDVNMLWVDTNSIIDVIDEIDSTNNIFWINNI